MSEKFKTFGCKLWEVSQFILPPTVVCQFSPAGMLLASWLEVEASGFDNTGLTRERASERRKHALWRRARARACGWPFGPARAEEAGEAALEKDLVRPSVRPSRQAGCSVNARISCAINAHRVMEAVNWENCCDLNIHVRMPNS